VECKDYLGEHFSPLIIFALLGGLFFAFALSLPLQLLYAD
jgi:hypothetical protein